MIDDKVLGDPGPFFVTDLDLDVKSNSSDFLCQFPPTCNVGLG